MKVLAVRQPWASLIVEGLKTLEVRSRPTNIRGRVAIYGSSHNPTIAEQNWFMCTVQRMEDYSRLTTEQKKNC
ncbi:ASCH domain-containing protein [Methanosarcina horonobensis]|uniref:ASCH domain-containing protein n=1 Tax=Methanosarcina horonobensis TaxID=418008 RepID=UPI000AAC056F|nr:ASCH domain-containing protein [Methanosarcina horonobensis]